MGIPERTIPNYLKAKSLLGLRRLMIRNNAKHGCYFPYFDIQFVKGSWFCFYFQDVEHFIKDQSTAEQQGVE